MREFIPRQIRERRAALGKQAGALIRSDRRARVQIKQQWHDRRTTMQVAFEVGLLVWMRRHDVLFAVPADAHELALLVCAVKKV
jgi:hypothetical protein